MSLSPEAAAQLRDILAGATRGGDGLRRRKHKRESERDPLRAARHRRRHRSSSSDAEDPGMFAPWKTIAVLVCIAVCFCILYPKMFHPMLMFALGYGPEKEKENDRPSPRPQAGRPPTAPGGMRGGPPPGGNTGGLGKGDSGGGSGRGMWHSLLPFYSIGVIVFLLYTLSKIFWRSPKTPGKRRHQYNMRYNANRERFEIPGAEGTDSESESSSGAEDLSMPGKMGKRELKKLQSRLFQTESAMQKILEQLEQLQHADVDEETANKIRAETMETLSGLSKDANVMRLAEAAQKYKVDGPITEQTTGDAMEESKDDAHTEEDSESSSGIGTSEKKSYKDVKKENPGAYLSDLERALSDFRSLTEAYMSQEKTKREDGHKHVHKKVSKCDSASTSGAEGALHHQHSLNRNNENEMEQVDIVEGFDAMECEDTNNLTLPTPTGCILGAEEADGIENPTDDVNESSNTLRKRH